VPRVPLIALKRATIAWCVCLSFCASACASVAPYERGRLAHPSMSSKPRHGAARAHLYAIREGATGGQLAAGSGCGCN
jgi:hypothetical protein